MSILGLTQMEQYFLGADVGSSKTHVLIAEGSGRILGRGESGAGNHEVVGYSGLVDTLQLAASQAISSAGIKIDQISGAGFGVSGYDWPSERAPTLGAIGTLRLEAPLELVNDAILGLLAGSPRGWGIAIVSGTGCNCRGWDRERRREGRVTGNGSWMGEGAGASELVDKALQAVAHEWTLRGPQTQLTPAFLDYLGCRNLYEMLESLATGQKSLDASAAPLIFQTAEAGDEVAIGLIRWAGNELGELAISVIRQLAFAEIDFDAVLIGSLFDGGELLIEPLRHTIHAIAPGARLRRLTAPPVTGAVILAMEAAGITPSAEVHQRLTGAGERPE